MREFSEEEITYLLKALIEHKADLQRLDPYPEQAQEIEPYDALIRELIDYRRHRFPNR